MKIDLDDVTLRANTFDASSTMSQRDREVAIALVASIRELYDAAFSASSLLPTPEGARCPQWHAEQARVRDIIRGAVARFGDSLVGDRPHEDAEGAVLS